MTPTERLRWCRVSTQHRRRLATIALLVAGCRSSAPSGPTPELTRPAARADVHATPLPAGTYFRGYDTCGECDRPRHAVVADIVDTPAAAQALIAALPDAPRAPGYPLVVHTDELGPADSQRGIAIVLGLFATAEAANAWAAHEGGGARVLPLLDDEAWWPSEKGPIRVVRIAVTSANAYDRREVERIEAELQDRQWETLAEAQLALRARVLALAPACPLARGSIQLWTRDDGDRIPWYEWAPVRCGDTEAYVAWRDTWLDSSVVPSGDGGHIVVQVTGAECDTPILGHWAWNTAGKASGEPTKPLHARGGG